MEQLPRETRIIREYRIQYTDPLYVVSGERVSVGREDNEFPGWKWCRASSGREGWVHVDFLADSAAGKPAVICNSSSRELAAQTGEKVTVEEARHEWLLIRNNR